VKEDGVAETTSYDAVVVGAGPNGLTAAIVLARAGLSVMLIEGAERAGGGCRTAELTLPGFHHDVCAAIHPMGVLSPVFRELDLERYGLKWRQTIHPLAHVMEDRAVLLKHSVDETAFALGPDSEAWRSLVGPFLREKDAFFEEILKPVRFPKRPILMARFGLKALRSCVGLIDATFKGEAARALFTGCAAHSIMRPDAPGTASFGLVLALAGHALGWPCAEGGSGQIIAALQKCFKEAGGEIRFGQTVTRLDDLPGSRVVLFDLTPKQVADIAGPHLPLRYMRALKRFQYGPGAFKVDWALAGPVPWRDEACMQAAMVHVGGTAEEIMLAEHDAATGTVPKKPFVLFAQQSLFDPTRAPQGKHTGWAYCHVPPGCTVDITDRIEDQIERFAPGFRDLIMARHTRGPGEYEAYNPNFVGGDIGGGANTLRQFLFRPVVRYDPYSTPNEKLFLCSSSTPPGGGVHGMCGYWAARSALRKVLS
jgi:phytoene dehydrogenase-like protein